jgi:hypothetical protein
VSLDWRPPEDWPPFWPASEAFSRSLAKLPGFLFPLLAILVHLLLVDYEPDGSFNSEARNNPKFERMQSRLDEWNEEKSSTIFVGCGSRKAEPIRREFFRSLPIFFLMNDWPQRIGPG